MGRKIKEIVFSLKNRANSGFKIILLIGGLLILTNCGSKESKKAKKGEKIIIASSSDVTSLTPLTHATVPTGRLDSLMYDKLFSYNENGELVPILAESFKYIDDNTIEIKIKKGVKFHNGEELTADDVAFTFKFWKDAKVRAFMIEAVKDVEIIDKYTILIKTKEPFAPLIGNIAAMGHVVNKKNIENNPNWKSEPVGTGAYKYVKWVSGDYVEVEAFDDYFAGKPQIKKIILKSVPEGSSRTMGLEAGDYDMILDPEPIDKKIIQNNSKFSYYETESFIPNYISINLKNEVLKDKNLRKAIENAIDIQGIIDVAADGDGIPAATLVAPQIFGANKEIPWTKKNIELAKEYMKKSNYPDGVNLSITIANSSVTKRIAEIIQSNLKEIGINLKIETYDWGVYIDRTGKGQHELAIMGWSNNTGDPDYSLYPLLHTKSFGPVGNRSFYSNKELDDLLDLGRITIDSEKREIIYKKAQEIIKDDVPVIPLYYRVIGVAAKKEIKGIKLDKTTRHEFRGLSFE